MLSEASARIGSHILQKLKTGLSPRFTYHTIYHVEDVVRQAERIAVEEGVTGEEDLFLLKIAALYHDSGFLFAYTGHEEKSCEIAGEELPRFGITPLQLDRIKGLIKATRVPQSPTDHLEQILCDADLDYLGRDDFYTISGTLFRELVAFDFLKDEDEWNKIQVRFLESHHYFTKTSIRQRKEKKLIHLAAIRKLVKECGR